MTEESMFIAAKSINRTKKPKQTLIEKVKFLITRKATKGQY